MFVTELIEKSSTAVPTYDEPRGGNKAVFAVDVVTLAGSFPSLTVKVEHKNRDETSFSVADTFSTITLPGTYDRNVVDLKEQVRMTFTLSAGDWARVRVFEPEWTQH